MATVLATLDPMKFPGADHVEQNSDGYTVYGKAVNSLHPAIAIIKTQKDGKLLIDAEPSVISKLMGATPVSAVDAAAKYPFYTTTVEVKLPGRKMFHAEHHGPRPVGTHIGKYKIVKSEPAPDWTLEKIRRMQCEIAKPVAESIEPVDLAPVVPITRVK